MQELSEIINQGQRDTPFKLIHWLQTHHVEIMAGKKYKVNEFIREIFTLVLQRPNNYETEEWEKLTIIIFTFIISTIPPPNIISKLSLNKKYGPLFSISLLLNSMRPPDCETKKQYIEIFQIAVDYFNKGFNTSHFYSRSPIYFYHLIPTLLDKEISTPEFAPMLIFFLQSIPHIKEKDLNYDFVLFTSEVFKRIKDGSNMRDDIIASFKRIFELSCSSSYIFLQHFFYSWFYFVKKYCDVHSDGLEVFSDQIDTVTKLFFITASLKHHELHRTFHWYLCFYFFSFVKKEEYQERILALICNGIRRANRFDAFPRIPDIVKKFSERWKTNYRHMNSWALHYMLTSLNSTIYALILNMERIIGAASMNSTQNEVIALNKVFFSDENNGLSPLDSELYSLYPEKLFKTLEEVVPAFDLMIKYCDSIRKHLSSVALFQLSFAKNICELLREELENGSNEEMSVPLHYLVETIRSWTRLMIVAAHRQNVMNTFSQREIVSFPNFPRYLAAKIMNPKRSLEFTAIFKRFFDIIEECPKEFYSLIAFVMAGEMFNAMKKRYLTYTFIEYFRFMPLDQNFSESLISNILSRMMEIAATNTDLFFSQSVADTNLLYLWVIFTIRFGSSLTGDQKNPLLGLFLNSYQKLFVAAVLFNIKRIVNQSIALKAVTIFLQQIKFHYQQSSFDKDDDKRRKVRGRSPIVIEDIQESAKIEAFDTVLTLLTEEPHYIELKYLIPFLEETFRLGDQRLITKAAKACLQKFDTDKASKYINIDDSNVSFFDSFFSIVNKVELDLGKRILKLIPAYSPLYLKTQKMDYSQYQGILIDEYGFNMESILMAVTNQLDGNDEIFAALFTLIVCCFKIILKNLKAPPKSYTKSMIQLITLLCHCWCHNHLHPQIESYAYSLAHQFGDAFIRCESNVFILSLLDVAGRTHSAMSKTALDIAKTFLEYISTKTINDYFFHVTVNMILCWFPPSSRLFSMLCSFSLFNRYFPKFIMIDHVRSFLIQTTDVNPLDIKFAKIVNCFLKEYLANKTDNEKRIFVQMVYDIICPLSMGIRNVLMKRVEQLGIPMPVHSLTEIEECSTPFLFAERATLALLCGIEGTIEITSSFYQKIKEFISQKVESVNSFEKVSRTLSLILAILKNDAAFKYFSENNDLLVFLQILCQALTTRVAPLGKRAKKCFNIIKNKSIKDSRFEKQLDDFYKYPEMIFKFFSSQPDKINLYVRLAKIIPSKIPPHIVKIFLDAVFEYDLKSDSEKMLNVSHFIKILKFLTIKDYITDPNIVSIIFSEYNPTYSYFQMFIKTICHLYEHNEIPFSTLIRKYVIRFLIFFPDQTVNFLINSERSSFFFVLLNDIIINDETMTFYKSFVNHFECISDYANIHPVIFKITQCLSEEEKYCVNPIFLQALKTNFDNLYLIISDATTHNENDYTLISYCAMSMINVFKYQISVRDVISFIRIFRFSFFSRSHISKAFLNTIFKNTSQEFLNELLDYIVSNATTLESIYIQKLLPHLIRNIANKDLSFLWDLLPKWAMNQTDSQYAFLHSILRLLEKNKPTKEALKIILEVIKTTISSSDIRLLIYSLKIATSLSKMKLLHEIVYFSIFRQLFTYAKFSEPPYSNYFFAFLKSDTERLTQITVQDFDLLSYYMHNRLLHPRELQKVLSPINSVFIAAPELISYLPFSLITAVTTLLENRLYNPNKDDEPNEVGEAFAYAANFCLIMKPTQEELKYFIHVGFHYLNNLIFNNNNNNSNNNNGVAPNPEFIEYFYNLLTSNQTDYFPEEMLSEIRIIDNNTFGLICCASNIIPDILFSRYPHLADDSLKYVEIESKTVNNQCLQCFMKALCSSPSFEDQFKRSVNHALDVIKSWYSAKNCDRLFIISQAMISRKSSKTLDDLWSFYDTIPDESVDQLPLLRFLIRSIEDVPLDNQIEIVQKIFSNVRQSAKKTHVFTTSLPFIFQSTTVINSAKKYIIENLIPLLLIDKLCNAEKMLAMLYEYNKQTNCTQYIIQLLLIRAHRAHDSGALLFIEKVINMLEPDFKDRIIYLMTFLPIEMWEDSFLPVIISLLIPKNEIWYPLFTLAHKFSSIGSELIAVTFAKLIDETNTFNFERFLANLLRSHLKVKHMQIISGVLTMFHMKKVKIAYHLTEKAIKYTGNFYQFEFFFEPGTKSIPAMRYLFPHDANDIIFGIYRPYLNKIQSAAVALTFITEYEAAYQTYATVENDYSNSSLFFKEMEKVNNHFIIKDDSLRSLLIPLKTIGHEYSAVDWIEVAAISYSEKLDTEALEKATEANLSTTIGKQFFSPYEKQRLCVIQSMVSLLEGKSELNSDSSCMNHVLIELYEKFKKFLNNNNNDNDESDSSIASNIDPVIYLSPLMKNSFREVCGFTHHGLIAIGFPHIEEFINKMAIKIESNEMLQNDYQKLADFLFSIYTIQPTAQLSTAAFGAYAKILMDDNLDFPLFITHEAATRIITMIRIAFNQMDEPLMSTIRSLNALFHPNNGEKWTFWLAHLVELSRVPWFCDMIFDMIKTMPYRLLLYGKKHKLQWHSDLQYKTINENQNSQLLIMNLIENFFGSLFSLNFDEKQIQTNMTRFLVETQKILRSSPDDSMNTQSNSIYNINLIEERKKAPISPFQRALKQLTMSQIELFGDFNELCQHLLEMSLFDIIEYVQNITHSSRSLVDIHHDIQKYAHGINENLPFILPLRFEKLLKISINYFHDDFEVINSDTILCKLTSSMHNWQNYVVQRSKNEGYHKSILTLANSLYLLDLMLEKNYLAQRRRLSIFPGHLFEIGDKLYIFPTSEEPSLMEDAFVESEMMSTVEFLSKYVTKVNNDDGNGESLELNEAGRERIKFFDTCCCIKRVARKIGEDNFLRIRPHWVNSLIVSCVFKRMFNSSYPDLSLCIFTTSIGVPVIYSDYDNGLITKTEESISSEVRLSPNVMTLGGPTIKGRFVIIMGIVCKALTENIEVIRSFIETLIGDEDFDYGRTKGISEIIEARTKIEEKFLKFCPPTGKSIGINDTENWISRIETFIDKAMNPDIQPVKSIPWF